MIKLLTQVVSEHGDKVKMIPIERLQDIAKDIENLKNSGLVNDGIAHIVNDSGRFDLPETEFVPRSIIIVASPSPLVRVYFNWNSKRIPIMIPPIYMDMESRPVIVEQYLSEFLGPYGHHVKYVPRLLKKLLAVRSGLGVYGRNNICYVEGMGSFANLATFLSDIPCEDEVWQEIRRMESCKTCKACLNNCPTGAITEDSYLLRSDRCLTRFNEHSDRDFPEWMHPSAHNSIVGCMKCQSVCPKNKKFLDNIIEPVEFTTDETLSLLNGTPLEQFSEELMQKVKVLEMVEYLGVLSRNLKVLFNLVD